MGGIVSATSSGVPAPSPVVIEMTTILVAGVPFFRRMVVFSAGYSSRVDADSNGLENLLRTRCLGRVLGAKETVSIAQLLSGRSATVAARMLRFTKPPPRSRNPLRARPLRAGRVLSWAFACRAKINRLATIASDPVHSFRTVPAHALLTPEKAPGGCSLLGTNWAHLFSRS